MHRPSARLGLLTALVLSVSALGTGTAFADGSTPGGGSLGLVNGVLIFAVAPIGAFLIIAMLVMRPGSGSGGTRYRPGKDWNAPASWIGIDPAAGATALPAGTSDGPEHLGDQGGAGASW